jgi:type I restriction enzyme S subunit
MQKNIPTDWKIVSISEIGKIETGTTPSKLVAEYYGPEYPFYKPSDLDAGINVFKSIDGLTKLGVDKARFVAENTTLVTCIGATIGKTGFLKKGGGFNQQINAIVPNVEMNPKFIYYQAISLDFQKQIKDNASATTLPLLNKSKFQLLTMVTCAFGTQTLIVSKIEELFSELDKGIEDLKTAQQQLKTYRQSVLKWAFEGKLTNKKVKNWELPKNWELKTLGEVLKVSSGKGIKINQLKGGNYSVYGGNGLNGFHSEYFIEEPVLIIGRVGVKCGVTHITKPKSWVSDNALIVKPIIKDFDIKFFKLRLEFENLNKLSVSTAQPVISGNSIYSVTIFLPHLEEQQRILQEIESRLSVADKMEESIAQSLLQAEALRQSILKKAFSGELIK